MAVIGLEDMNNLLISLLYLLIVPLLRGGNVCVMSMDYGLYTLRVRLPSKKRSE